MKKRLAKLKNKLFGIHNSYNQLEKDNHQYISLIRNSVLPIIFLSTDGLITYANQSFIKMVGYSHSEIKNESAFLFIKTQQDSDSEKSFFAGLIKKQLIEDKTLEIQFRKKTGELGWVAIESLMYKRETVNHERFIQCILRDITREKELQTEIDRLHKTTKEQAVMLHNLIENTEGHIVVRKIDDTITWANNRFLETFGFSSEEVVGKTELNLWPVDVQRKISVATRVAIRTKERATIELSIDNKGKQVAVQMTIFPIFNEFGCVEFTGVLAVDVSQLKRVESERKKAFAEAKNSKRLLRNFIDNASTPIYALDLNNRITIANIAFANRYGLSKEELYGKNLEEFETLTGIEVNEAIPEANRQVIDERKPVNFECSTFQPVLNKITHINYAVFPLLSDDGTLLGTGTIMSDRTQTVEQVIELENTRHNADIYKLKAEYHEYLLQSYMDNVPYYASIIDLEGNFEFINKYALDLWGEAKSNIKNKHYAKFIKNDRFLQYIAHDLEYAVNERKYIETEEVFSQPDKEDITFLSTTFPMFNKNGEIFAIGIFRKDITDRKHAELERERLQDDVKTQHALLSSVIDSAPDFISIKNKEHRYIMVNLGLAKALHLFPADFIGKDDLELGFPEELVKGNLEKGITGFWADNCMVMDSGQPQAIPFEPVAIDGVMHTFRTIKTPLKNVDGQVWGVLTFSHDITNELRQQEALRQSEERFRLLYNSTPAMLYSINPEGEITNVSDYWLEIMGYVREEVIGQKLAGFVTKESLQYSREVVWPFFLKNGSCHNEEFEFIKKDGEIITCLLSAVAQMDNAGLLVGSLEVLEDVTELRKKENELIEAQQVSETSKQLLKSFMDNATSAMFAKDENGVYILTNTKKEEYEQLRELARSNTELNSLDFYNSELSRIDDARVIAQNTPMTFYDRLLSSDDSVLYTETVKFPIYDKNNKLIGVGGITKDITDSKIREEELEAAKQKAEDAASSQERFLASMSHDMRTPLNGVVGMINLMEQTSLSAEQKEYMEAMKVSSYNLRVLINDILDVSKIQAGKLNIECILFDLNEILVSVNNVFTHEASMKGVSFSIELPPDTPVMLEGDPSRLSQILNNLIGNALKFTAKGFVKLKLLYENLVDDKVNIEFVIEDSGIGISEEGLGKLFQPFVQASSDTSRKFGGSGLGLSICKSLVDLQQGEISVSSELGKGSVFRFNIPYLKAEQSEIDQAKQQNRVSEFISVQPLPPLRCLVFEDNLINQKVAFHTLKKVGITADMSNNGKIGVDILKKNAPLYDFVLMDIQMPEMDGYEATSVIRNELGLKIPIIAMTASALKGEKERCIEAGMNDFVPKPFVIDELLYVVRKLIKNDHEEETILHPPTEDTDKILNETVEQHVGFGDEPLYDLSNVLEMDDVDFTLEILNVFLDTVPKALEELKTGIAQATDWDTVNKVAHKLKGGVGVLQMNEMIKQLSTIEVNARSRCNMDQLPESLYICCRIYDVVKDEITKLRDEMMPKM